MKVLLSFILCLFISSNLWAQDLQMSSVSNGRHIRPGDRSIPTPVNVSVFMVDILDIDDVNRTITMDYFLYQTWEDPRLSKESFPERSDLLDLKISDIWNPRLAWMNRQDHKIQESSIQVTDSGTVRYRQRCLDTFTAPLDLREFPFDSQEITLSILSTFYSPQEIDLIWNSERAGYLHNFSIPGWTFLNVSPEIINQNVRNIEESRTGVDIIIELERDSGFYVWKVFVPLGFIIFMAWTVFWFDPADLEGQIAISTASVITLIAFQLGLVDLLPRISYLTNIDVYALGTSFLIFIALGESILTARLARLEKYTLALRIDRWMRSIYPIVFTLLLLYVIL